MKSYVVLALLALTLSACGAAEPEPQATPSPAPEASTTAPEEAAVPAEQAEETEGPTYFGAWNVEDAIASAAVSTAPDDSLKGASVAYSIEAASFGEESVQNPQYVEKELTDAEFLSEFRTAPADLGLEGGTVRIVEVADWTNPGGTFLVKDENTLIFLWDGNYYEMKREQ
jgi:hypothetical protein